ncbi:MAG TPA: 7-carboxy-7-deazaguanine synthase QueE [Salinivirga sp.]|uniref:7-carboxy-7-deazaguanine synthase QueE n=1 Tax=Salinivirga sp. TaxID=1970192 RepID=UPI002B476A84|nr:7-carboxy-7-deazaguanine synthase QueE [Salinivirga sp.]HKK60366.1 7-carboxy-7-deazaguanine synthase QueE [Salinivirga sp.]
MAKSQKSYQKVDSELLEGGKKLPLVESFYSIQGEGHHSGKPAYFIRVGGCDIACHWCDSKISWNADLHPLVSVDEIVNQVLNTPARSVVVTGGEPAMYPLDPLSTLIRRNNISNFLESSGAYEITGQWDWICISPKHNKHPLKQNLKRADELKIVIFSQSDFDFAEQWKKEVSAECKLLLQPEYSQFKKMAPSMVEYVKAHPEWNISLQSHKYLDIP